MLDLIWFNDRFSVGLELQWSVIRTMIIGRWVQYLHGRLYKLYEQKKWWASLGDGLFPGRVRSIGMAGFLQNDDISTEGQPTSTLCMYKCIPNFIIYIYTHIHTCVQIIQYIKTFEIYSIYPASSDGYPAMVIVLVPLLVLLRFSSPAVFIFMVKSWWIGWIHWFNRWICCGELIMNQWWIGCIIHQWISMDFKGSYLKQSSLSWNWHNWHNWLPIHSIISVEYQVLSKTIVHSPMFIKLLGLARFQTGCFKLVASLYSLTPKIIQVFW